MPMTLISTHTASASSSIDITSGIDSTYDLYEFHCVGIHPSGTSLPNFEFQVNTAAETGWNRLITSTYFAAGSNYTADGANNWADIYYSDGEHLTNQRLFQKIAHGAGDEDDDSSAVILKLYAPSSSTYIKNFISVSQMNHHNNSIYVLSNYAGGYIHEADAVTQIRFQFGVGNIDAGTIKMFGVS